MHKERSLHQFAAPVDNVSALADDYSFVQSKGIAFRCRLSNVWISV